MPYDDLLWLRILGIVFCVFNVALFTTNCVLITLRFCFCPGSLVKSFTDQVESLFIASFVGRLQNPKLPDAADTTSFDGHKSSSRK